MNKKITIPSILLLPATHVLLFGVFLVSLCQAQAVSNKQLLFEPRWEKVGPGGGGSTFIPTFSYNTPDHFLVRCDMTGSYLTKNGGNSYQQINFANGASAYAYDPKDKNTIYIGSTFLNRSTDGGKTWQRLFPAAADIKKEIYQGDHAGFSIETRETSLYNGNYDIGVIRVDPDQPGSLYFSMGPGLFYTSDSGKTWSKEILDEPVISMYTNSTSAKNELFIFTGNSIYTFNKSSHQVKRTGIPRSMAPVFSCTSGTLPGTDKIVIYALHHDSKQEINGEFGYSEVWQSEDKGGKLEAAHGSGCYKFFFRYKTKLFDDFLCGI